MRWIIYTPYKPIWLTIPWIMLLSLGGINRSLDFQLHDTFFVLATVHVGSALALILAIVGLIYWWMRDRSLIKWMTLVHLASTIISSSLILLVSIVWKASSPAHLADFQRINQALLGLIGILLVGQILFLINVNIALIRGKPIRDN